LKRILVRLDQLVRGDVRLPYELRDDPPLPRIGQHSVTRSMPIIPLPPERATICAPICSNRSIAQGVDTGSGAIAHEPTIQAARDVTICTSPPTPVEFSP